jgi:tellurite resistance protein TerC
VLAGAMSQFKYLKLALAVLLVLIGIKMLAHDLYHMPHAVSLALIAGIIGTGVLASVISNRRTAAEAEPAPPAGSPSELRGD